MKFFNIWYDSLGVLSVPELSLSNEIFQCQKGQKAKRHIQRFYRLNGRTNDGSINKSINRSSLLKSLLGILSHKSDKEEHASSKHTSSKHMLQNSFRDWKHSPHHLTINHYITFTCSFHWLSLHWSDLCWFIASEFYDKSESIYSTYSVPCIKPANLALSFIEIPLVDNRFICRATWDYHVELTLAQCINLIDDCWHYAGECMVYWAN